MAGRANFEETLYKVGSKNLVQITRRSNGSERLPIVHLEM